MNDDFLSNFRKSPRPEFAQSLHTKLTQDAKTRLFAGRNPTSKRIAYSLTVLCLIFALGIAVSPAAARAVVERIIATLRMRGVTVFVTDDVHDDAPVPTGEEKFESYSFIWTPVTPRDLSVNYPFFAKLPTWVPTGYVLQERVALYYGNMYGTPGSSLFQWKDNTGETIQLEVMRGSCPNGEFYDPDGPLHDQRPDCTLSMLVIVGPDSEMEVLTVNGQPAILFHGGVGFADLSGSVGKWNPYRGRSAKDATKGMWMTWESDGRTFRLIAESATITQEDLLRMAESIP